MADKPCALLHSSTAQAQRTIARQMRELATVATTTLKFALGNIEQQQFVGSSKLPNRLAAYGYQNRITHTRTHIALSKQAQSQLHLVMLSFKQALSADQRSALDDGTLQIKTQNYAGHHLYKGGRAIVSLSDVLKAELSDVQSTFAQVPDQPCCFVCPTGHPRPSNSQFDVHNVAKSIWCSACKRLPCFDCFLSARVVNRGIHAACIFVLQLVMYSSTSPPPRVATDARRLLTLKSLHENF